MEMFNRLTDSSFILEMIVANIFFPIVVALLKAVVNYTSNGVLVSKYDDERANHYLYVFMLKLWKTTALPMGIYIVMSIILSSNEYEVTLDAVLLAVGSILFSMIVFWLFLTSLNMKRIGIMLKAILTALISNMVLIVLCRRFAPNVLDRWVLIMWACIQMVILEILLYEDGYYNDLSSNCFQIMECVISIAEIVIVFTLTAESSWVVKLTLSLAMVVIGIDVYMWRIKLEPPIEKRVVVKVPGNTEKEYVTHSAIKRTCSGNIYFLDDNRQEVYVSENSVRQILFDSKWEIKLSRKIQEFHISYDPMTILDQEWYVKSSTKEWIRLYSWNGTIAKNIMYPKKDVYFCTGDGSSATDIAHCHEGGPLPRKVYSRDCDSPMNNLCKEETTLSTEYKKEIELQDFLKNKMNYRNFCKNHNKEQLAEYVDWRLKNENDMRRILANDQKILLKLKQMIQYMCKKNDEDKGNGNIFLFAVPVVSTFMSLCVFYWQMEWQICINEVNTALVSANFATELNSEISPFLQVLKDALAGADVMTRKEPIFNSCLFVVCIGILLVAVIVDAHHRKKRIKYLRYYQELFDIADRIIVEKDADSIDTVVNHQQGVHLEK